MLRILLFLFCLKQCCSFKILNNASFVKHFSQMKSLDVGEFFPEHWDLRDVDMVSPVKNQLDCSACWAFSVIANLESRFKMYNHEEVVLSEQFLIDCDIMQEGCKDGSMIESYAEIVTTFGGVILQDDYPYRNSQGACRVPIPPPHRFEVMGFRKVIGEDDMVWHLYSSGPLSAAINSNSMARWKYQEDGIDEPSDEDCNPMNLNHAVLIVGFSVARRDEGSEVPYWIIKNSWGINWGDNGYYYLVRGRNACGVARDVSYPIVSYLNV